MGTHHLCHGLATVLVIAAALTVAPALAGHGERGNKGKGHRESSEASARYRDRHFSDEQRVFVHEYYHDEFRRGKCPPGLAKKRNGCMPPGQAKKWRLGRPLPRDVVYYEVPQTVVVKLGAPPPGHRYVRVAADILLIAVGTGMVVDAIQDLGRM